MIRILALAAALAAVPVVMAAPAAVAYDPCQRATSDFRSADAAYSNYCGLYAGSSSYNGYVCARPGPRGRNLYNIAASAHDRMRSACR